MFIQPKEHVKIDMCRTLTKYSQNVTMPRQSRYKCTIKLHHIPNMIHKTPPVNLVLSLENGAHVTQYASNIRVWIRGSTF